MQENLLIIRKNKGVSQQTLAKLLNISLKQYGYKENGKVKFNGDEMFLLSKYFGMKIENIFLPTTHQNGDKNIKKESSPVVKQTLDSKTK